MERNDLCWCGSGKKYKKCHMPIEEKMMLHAERGEIVPSRKLLNTPHQIEMIKKSAALNTAVLDEVAKHIRIGMSTAEIDFRFLTRLYVSSYSTPPAVRIKCVSPFPLLHVAACAFLIFPIQKTISK